MDDLDERRLSFGTAAAAYAAHRPGYPDAAVEWALAPAPGGDVLDLGAGTGKLTAALVARPDTHVIAVEPDGAMLDLLSAELPTVDARLGSGEAIPVPDASLDAVLIGQAWHWMDPGRTFAELARVLRPGGVVAALWNDEDRSVEWVAGYQDAAGIRRPSLTTAGPGHGGALVDERFTDPAEAEFANGQPTSIDGLEATLRTHSWALTAAPDARERALATIRDYLSTRPETSSGTFVLPLVTSVVRTLRK